MSDRKSAQPIEAARRGRRARAFGEMGAALAGVAAGVWFAEPVIAASAGVWNGYILPAYDELIKNGFFAWCM